jgi:hypothetical protein
MARAHASTCSVEWIHDIDHFTDNLIEFAQLEREYGVTAKYFIRMHARYYNPLSTKTVGVLKRIVNEFGHQLGLHFEHHFYPPEQVQEAIKKEQELLSYCLSVPISYLSSHLPNKCGVLSEEVVPKDMTYYGWSSHHYQGKKYISDSGGRWREGCMCNHIGKHPQMVILTHDVWWFTDTPAENY